MSIKHLRLTVADSVYTSACNGITLREEGNFSVDLPQH